MSTNDYGVWHDKLNTFTKYGTPVSAVDSVNSAVDAKTSGNAKLISTDGAKKPTRPSDWGPVAQPGAWDTSTKDEEDKNKTNVAVNGTYFRGRNYKYTPIKPAEGQDFWSAVGDILSQPLRLGTSLLLTLGTGAQAVRHLVDSGPNFSWDAQNEWLGKQLENAWTDPFKTSMIWNNKGFLEEQKKPHADLGTALTYGLGQTVALGADIVIVGATGGGNPISGSWDKRKDNQEAIQTFNWFSKNWGTGFTELDFDPFSLGHRATVIGAEYNPDGTLKLDRKTGMPITGSGWTLGNVSQQFFGNFVGGLALDPLSYIPIGWIGKVGKTLFQGRRLLTGVGEKTVAKHIATDMTEWGKIAGLADSGANAEGRYLSKEAAEQAAKGQNLDYWEFARFAANSNADQISRHTVIKSITGGEKDQIAWLLGQAKTEQQVAKIFLATEYGSERAFAELVGANPKLFLALDEQMAGGYFVRGELKGTIAGAEVLDPLAHKQFYDTIAQNLDELSKDEFSRVLTNLMVKSGPEGIGPNTIVRELMPASSRLFGGLEESTARLGSFIVHGVGHNGAVSVARRFGNGTSFWYHQIVRPFTTTAKGMIDLEDAAGTAGSKFAGMLGDIDRLSRSALTEGGYRKDLMDAWRRALTPDAKAKVLQNAQELGLTLIAKRHGFTDDNAELISKLLTEQKRVFTESVDRTGVVVMKDGTTKIVYHDPFMVNQTANKVDIWDFNRVNDEIIKAKPNLLKDGSIGVPEYLASGAVYLKNGTSAIWNGIGRMFQSIILFKAGRTGRDAFQNGVSSLLSGYGGAMLKEAVNPGLALNGVYNTSMRIAEKLNRQKLRLLTYSSPQKIQNAIKSIDDYNMGLIEHEIIRIQKIMEDVADKNLEDIPYEDIPGFIKAAQELSSDTHYHISPRNNVEGVVQEVNQNFSSRGLAVFNNVDDANAYLATLGKDLSGTSISDSLILPDTVGARITKDTRNKVEQAIANGDIVHVRIPGRGRSWQLLDAKKFRGQKDADIAKYEIRVIKPKSVKGLLTKDELLAAIDEGKIVYANRGGKTEARILTKEDIQSIPDVTTIQGKIFEPGTFPAPVEVRSFGKEVTLKSFKDLPEDVAKLLKITSQKELDAWVAAKGYDKLTFSQIATLTRMGVGKLTVTQDGKLISILNPDLAQFGDNTSGFWTAVIGDLSRAGYNWRDIAAADIDEALVRKLEDLGFATGEGGTLQEMMELWKTKVKADPKKLKDTTVPLGIGAITRRRIGKDAREKYDTLRKTELPINARVANLYGVGDTELLAQLQAVKQTIINNAAQKEQLLTSLIRSQKAWDKLNAIKADRKHFETNGTVRIGQQDFAQSLSGVEGNIYMQMLSKDVEDIRLRDSLWKSVDSQLVTRVVKPNEEGYWEAWANVLNRHFSHDGKLDPVVKLIIEKQQQQYYSKEELIGFVKDWLKTPEGKKYAAAVGVGEKYSVVGPRKLVLDPKTGKMVEDIDLIRPDKVRFEQLDEDEFARLNVDNVTHHIGDIKPSITEAARKWLDSLTPNMKGIDSRDVAEAERIATESYGNVIAEKLLRGQEITPLELQGFHLGRITEGEAIGQRTMGEAEVETYGFDLPDIWATITDPSMRTLSQRVGRELLNKWNKAITDYPQRVFFQMPMFNAAYKVSLERQMAQKAISRGVGIDDVRLTEAERLNVVRNARQYALKETKKWIYSYTDGMKIKQALAAVVPFGNAFAFSIKSLANGARYNPAQTALMIYWANKLNNNTHWIDQNGDPVGFDEKDENDQRKAKYVQGSFPEWFFKNIAEFTGFESLKDVNQVIFNRQSLDPVYQGHYTNLGFLPFSVPNPLESFSLMPVPTIVLSEAVKKETLNTEDGLATWITKTFTDILPFGASTSQWSLDKLIPGNIAKAVYDYFTDGVTWQKSQLNAVQYVNGQYLLGKYDNDPGLLEAQQNGTVDMWLVKKAKDYAGPIFLLKATSDFFSPVATQYLTPGDIARKAYRSNRDKANAEFEAGGTDETSRQKAWEAKWGKNWTVEDHALWLTMEENSEWWYASVSPTYNKYGIEYNKPALERLKERKGVIGTIEATSGTIGMSNQDTTRIISWLVNGGMRNPTAEFDENAYIALQSEYLDPRGVVDFSNYVRVQAGWNAWNWGYTVTDRDGNVVEKLPGIRELKRHTVTGRQNPSDNEEIEPFVYNGQVISGTYGYWKNKLTNGIKKDRRMGDAWLRDKQKDIDPNKYNNMADVWWQIIYEGYDPETGMSKTYGVPTDLEVDIAVFLNARARRQAELRLRGTQTGRGTLAQNPDIEAKWNADLAPFLNGGNPNFEDWYYRFFDGDTLN